MRSFVGIIALIVFAMLYTFFTVPTSFTLHVGQIGGQIGQIGAKLP